MNFSLIIIVGVCSTLFFSGCSGESEPEPTNESSHDSSVAESGIGANTTGANNGSNVNGANCNLSPPVCSISVDPASSDSNRIPSGSSFYLTATCNTSLDAIVWYEKDIEIATAVLSLYVHPTVDAGYSMNIPYTVTYRNCKGKGTSQKKWIYIINAGSGGGNNSSSGSRGEESGEASITFVDWYVHPDGGDIARYKLQNTMNRKLLCVLPYSLEYYDQVYLSWKSEGDQVVKEVNANSSVAVDIHLAPQKARGYSLGTEIKNVKISNMTCK